MPTFQLARTTSLHECRLSPHKLLLSEDAMSCESTHRSHRIYDKSCRGPCLFHCTANIRRLHPYTCIRIRFGHVSHDSSYLIFLSSNLISQHPPKVRLSFCCFLSWESHVNFFVSKHIENIALSCLSLWLKPPKIAKFPMRGNMPLLCCLAIPFYRL